MNDNTGARASTTRPFVNVPFAAYTTAASLLNAVVSVIAAGRSALAIDASGNSTVPPEGTSSVCMYILPVALLTNVGVSVAVAPLPASLIAAAVTVIPLTASSETASTGTVNVPPDGISTVCIYTFPVALLTSVGVNVAVVPLPALFRAAAVTVIPLTASIDTESAGTVTVPPDGTSSV